MHAYESIIFAGFLFSSRSINVHGAFHLIPCFLPPQPPLFLFSLIVILPAFVSDWLFPVPSSFYSPFFIPAPFTSSSLCPSLQSSLLLQCSCVCECVSRRQRPLIVGFVQTPDTGAASRGGNVRLRQYFVLPRWMLSTVMKSHCENRPLLFSDFHVSYLFSSTVLVLFSF